MKLLIGKTNYKAVFASVLSAAVLICSSIVFTASHGEASGSPPDGRKFKILHINSYHAPWKWPDDQLAGFKNAFKDINVEYKVFQMDTKRKSSLEWKKKVANEAMQIINTWKPDLVYTNDDNAQKYIVKNYINSNTPFVFSGVNADPGEYGFSGSRNITGVLEQEHFVGSVELLKMTSPGVKKIAIIYDEGSTWPGVIRRMKQKLSQLPDIDIVSWDLIHTFDEYKEKIRTYQDQVDAIGLLGIFTYRDAKGDNVPYIDVLKWTAQNSRLPDFSFWKDRISHGTLCTVTVSGYEQGLAAGKIAYGILVEGRSPSSFPMEPTTKGEAVVSLARAKSLGIKIKSSLLLTAEVIEDFSWEK